MESSSKKVTVSNEEIEYTAEFSYILRGKIVATAGGLLLIISSILFPNLFFRIVIALGGLSIFYYGLRELIDGNPKLKIGEYGLWTKKLGHQPWSSIKMIRIEIDRYPINSSNTIKIYLITNETIHADQELYYDPLKKSETIKALVDEFCGKDLKCELISN